MVFDNSNIRKYMWHYKKQDEILAASLSKITNEDKVNILQSTYKGYALSEFKCAASQVIGMPGHE